MRNLQKNLNIIWQPLPFLDKPPPPFCLTPFSSKKFQPPPISINFEKVEPPPPCWWWCGGGGLNYAICAGSERLRYLKLVFICGQTFTAEFENNQYYVIASLNFITVHRSTAALLNECYHVSIQSFIITRHEVKCWTVTKNQ